jgi:hypothetical protein
VAVTNKEKYAVISKFEQLCKKHGLARQPLNRYAEQWAADGLIQSYGQAVVEDVMAYYFSINNNPQWKTFAYKFADLYKAKTARAEDDIYRAKLRAKMKELLDES